MIGIVGINHKTAPVSVRERFVFQEEEITRFLGLLKEKGYGDEAVLLSTCNRTELVFYANAECTSNTFNRLIRDLVEFKGIKSGIEDHFYTYSDQDAVDHLFQVAAGLDSLVLGENQILGQVKEAYRVSAEKKLTGAVLNRLFHRAFEAGKKVRSDTAINQGASSVSYAAVEVASKIFGDLSRHSVLLIGAGETGELVVQSLVERGSQSIHIANRTRRRAENLAEKYNAHVIEFGDFRAHLAEYDIIATSTASKELLIRYEDVKAALHRRKGQPAFFIDLSVPRDISEEIKKLENVFLYNIDDLEEVVAHNYDKRKNEIQKAGEITAKIAAEYLTWLSSLSLAPTISMLKEKINAMAESELKNLSRNLTEDEHQKVSNFAQFLSKKYLGLVIKNLRSLSNEGRNLEYIRLVNELFNLPGHDIREGS
jgi:glutamyl-tRNA reductase